MESERKWHFGFNEYYDVYIWDLEPGQPSLSLYSAIYEVSFKVEVTTNLDSDEDRPFSKRIAFVR